MRSAATKVGGQERAWPWISVLAAKHGALFLQPKVLVKSHTLYAMPQEAGTSRASGTGAVPQPKQAQQLTAHHASAVPHHAGLVQRGLAVGQHEVAVLHGAVHNLNKAGIETVTFSQ